MAAPRIEVRDLRKTFRTRNRSDSLRDALPRLLAGIAGRGRPPADGFVALDGVSFRLDEGEVLGIVGANGAGKSTMLRLVAGVYRPDGGTVSVRGRVSALIELSAGFHPDLSGRENIYLGGALLGLRTREVDALVEPIARFADIGDFLDAPVRTYSTGMAVRLGFAVAAHVPAEVLLVDEVLAVGDIDFQAKCLRRMAERRGEGVSVLIVSHNLNVLEQFCDRVLFLHHGRVAEEGEPVAVLRAYRRLLAEEKHVEVLRESASPRMRRGTEEMVLSEVRVGGPGAAPGQVPHGGRLRIEARWRTRAPVERPLFGVQIHSLQGLLCAESRSLALAGDLARLDGEGAVAVEFPVTRLLPGDYEVTVFARDRSGFVNLDLHQNLYPLRVTGSPAPGEGGLVALDPEWTLARGGG